MARTKPPNDPITVSKTASTPFPCKSNLCPGRILNAVSASGAPRNTEGIVSKNVCVTAIAIIIMLTNIGELYCINVPDILNKRMAIRLTCTPGINPVTIPNPMPNKVAVII